MVFLSCPEVDSRTLHKSNILSDNAIHESIGIATSHANNSSQMDGELFLYIDKPSEGGEVAAPARKFSTSTRKKNHREKRKDTEQAKKGEREKRRYVK